MEEQLISCVSQLAELTMRTDEEDDSVVSLSRGSCARFLALPDDQSQNLNLFEISIDVYWI